MTIDFCCDKDERRSKTGKPAVISKLRTRDLVELRFQDDCQASAWSAAIVMQHKTYIPHI